MDLTPTLAAKSNQINADDLIGGPLTIKITNISPTGNDQQPVSIDFEGGNGKSYLPCKSMRRVMVAVWGADGKAYIGRGLTLFRDPEVSYGGIKVGGVRISHMSQMDAPMAISLSEKRGKKTIFKVEPLVLAVVADPLDAARQQLLSAAESGLPQLEQAWKALPNATRKELSGDWWESLKAATTPQPPRVEVTGGMLTIEPTPVTVPTTTPTTGRTMADYLESSDDD
jgi:hypothetical protein